MKKYNLVQSLFFVELRKYRITLFLSLHLNTHAQTNIYSYSTYIDLDIIYI